MKTKQTKKTSHSPWTLLTTLVVGLIIVGGFLVVHHRHNTLATPSGTANGVNYNPPTTQEKQSAEDQKVKAIGSEPSTQQPAGTQTAAISSITHDTANHQVVVQTKLVGSGWGTCSLTLSKLGSPSVTLTADTLYQPSYSTCMGFTVADSSFSSSGLWTASLSVTNTNSGTVTATPATVTVEL